MLAIIEDSTEDRTRRLRRRLLLASACTYALWQVSAIIAEQTPRAAQVLLLLSAIGALSWAAVFLRLMLAQQAIAKAPRLARAMQDELVAEHRGRAVVAGFYAVFLAQGAFIVAHILHYEFSMFTAARLTIAVGLVTTAARFASLERD